MEKAVKQLAIDGGPKVRTKPLPEWPIYGKLEEEMVVNVVRSGKWGGTGGVKPGFQDNIRELQKQFAALHNADYGLCVANGTLAITVALQAAGVQPGDEVIVPPYTFIATVSAPLLFGAIPVFADIDPNTMMIDPVKVEQAITPRTKAIIAVHIAGAPADMTSLKAIADKHRLMLIEDAAQAVGASWEGVGVGAIGDIGTFSLQGSKNINAGEGGMILTNSKDLSDHAWSIINVGRIPQGEWYQHELIGQNYRITEFQAAIALAQMTRLEEQMAIRDRNAALLNDMLGQIKGIRLLKYDKRMTRHAYHGFVFRLDKDFADRVDKKEFAKKVYAEGIPVLAGYNPLNRNEAVLRVTKQWEGRERVFDCPVCERMCEKEALWFTPHFMIADEEGMHQAAEALTKVIDSY